MMVKWLFQMAVIIPASQLLAQKMHDRANPMANTYSIVARDTVTGEMAVGVQSHWFSVGTAVPWAKAGIGAVATQSFVDKSYGILGLALIEKGFTAQEALDSLLSADDAREVRQVSIIDHKGNIATHTGAKCIQYASHIVGNNFSVQSNMMLGPGVNENMRDAYIKAAGKPIAERVLIALEAAQLAGGDIRGMQAAAIIVVPGNTNTKPWNDKTVDLRVDDHNNPLKELRRLYTVHLAYQHMNNGDLAVEQNNMELAMQEYRAAMKLFPSNLEMKYWTAITLANNNKVSQALPILSSIYKKDKHWKELTRRLPPAGLLTVSEKDLNRILGL